MRLIRRHRTRREQALRAIKVKTIKAYAKKAVPTRLLVIVGGAGASVAALAVTIKKRKGRGTAGPSYAAPTGPPAAGS